MILMVVEPPALPRYKPAKPKVADPISYELVVFIGMELESDPVIVRSSLLALPMVTLPLSVAAPAQVSALMLRSLDPSVIPFMISVKLVLQPVTPPAFYPMVLALRFFSD